MIDQIALNALLTPFGGEILSFVLTIFGAYLFWVFRARTKLIWGRSNNSLHFVPVSDKDKKENDRIEIYTEKFFVQNTGRKSATEVEFVLNGNIPNDISMWQPRQYGKELDPNGNFVITIPFVAPGELVVIDTVYLNMRAADVVSVKCSEAVATQVPFWTLRRPSNPVIWTTAILMLLGIVYVVRLVLSLIFGF